jgi:uncharacterized protein YecT (DUF1311 family)
MLQVNLSTLSAPELRRLLDSTRERGQASLSYQILQEMAARRERGGRGGPKALFTGRRPPEPRVIAVDLGDPLDREDEPPQDDLPSLAAWDAPPPAEPETEPPLKLDTEGARRASSRRAKPKKVAPDPVEESVERPDEPPPLTRWPSASETAAAFQMADTPPRRARRSPWLAAGFVVGISAGVALGWLGAGITREHRAPRVAPMAATFASAPAATSAPAAPIAVTPLPVPEAPTDATTTADTHETPPPPDAADASHEVAAATATDAQPASVPAESPSKGDGVAPITEAVRIAPAGPKGCAAKPTPADRTICADPHLQRLQGQLREAYAKALQAHQDRDLLREHQLAWREARNDIADPNRLARLYEQRIQKLNAATVVAREQREAPH